MLTQCKAMNLKSGARLGPYEIHSLIGVGGMGELYRAYDPRLERFIAIKILSSGNSTDAERKRRFAQEARAASALNHPGIVTVYDVGSESGMDYIVMEFLAGSTLEALIPRNGFSIRDLLCYSAQAADAIAKAHSASILHRDIKPGNLIVTNDGCVKVLDFGLAKLERQPAHCDERTTASAAITDDGVIVGTPAYMSPEQAEGRPLDSRSDVFSFGSMLYEMATGRRPFQGDTAVATILSILRDEPVSVREIRPEMPAELERLIRRCLKKDPARRVQSMSDLKVALEELKEELDSGQLNSVSPPAGRKETGMVRAGTVIVVCAAIAIGFIQFPPRNRDQTVSRPTPLTSY